MYTIYIYLHTKPPKPNEFLDKALFMNSSTSGAKSLKSRLTCLSTERSFAADRLSPCAHASRSCSGKVILLGCNLSGWTIFRNPHGTERSCGHHDRRKFRSQTSDNMDRWKEEMGRLREERRREEKRREEKRREGKGREGKRREEKKKEDHKRESLRRKKIQVREKVAKSRNTVFFQWFVTPRGLRVEK